MRIPKVRELGEALRSLFSRPYTIGYPHKPAQVPEKFRGRPRFQEDVCIGCGACAQVCPARAIEVIDEVDGSSGLRRMVIHHDHCIFCGQCHRYCTTETGVILTNEFETGTFDRTQAVSTVEKPLVVCRECGEPIATLDHLRWVAERLGPKAYGNMGLALTLSRGLGIAAEDDRGEGRPLDRGDNVSVRCPKCRRETILYELWGP